MTEFQLLNIVVIKKS